MKGVRPSRPTQALLTAQPLARGHPTAHPRRQAGRVRGTVIPVTFSQDESASAAAHDPVEATLQPSADPKVAEAMDRAQAALTAANEAVDNVPNLPSARLPTLWDSAVVKVKPVVQLSALLAYCMLIHAFHAASQAIGGLFLALVVAARGYKKRSLSASGAVAAVAVGWATLAPSFRAGMVLLAFFFSSSKLTQLSDEDKAVADDHKAGGQRDWVQVACNGAIPAILTVAAACLTGGFDATLRPAASPQLAALYGAFLGYFSCCCGDTWASELGQLSKEEPRLITSMRPVRKGTNGGVTLLGLGASVAGGLFIGLTFYAAGIVSPTGNYSAGVRQWPLILLGMGAGLYGSIIDSVLGATLQFTGYNRRTGKITGRTGEEVTRISGFHLLDNNGVNLVSASLTAALTAAVALLVF